MTAIIDAINPGQWVILATILIGFATAYFKFRPDQTRADTEATVVNNAEVALRFREFRDEVHGYKNQVMALQAAQKVNDKKQLELEKLLTHALATSSVRRDQMNSMMALIELLIAELEKIDPKSIIVPQAKVLLKQMRDAAQRPVDPMKSDALNTAEHAVADAKQTVISATATCEEVKQAEGEK